MVAPRSSSFCHVNAREAVSPCELRLVTFTWSASYQLLPTGEYIGVRLLLNCGKGRNACSKVEVAGKAAYGSLKPRDCGCPEAKVLLRRVRSAALFGSRPKAASRCAVSVFMGTSAGAVSHTPRLPT